MIVLYKILLFALRITISLLAPFNKKLAGSIGLRKIWTCSYIESEWEKIKKTISSSSIDVKSDSKLNIKSKKIFWFHASSVGEWEQAKPVLALLKKNENCIIVASYFSPSVQKMGSDFISADFVFPLPFDFYTKQKKLVSIINPNVLIFVKYDAWLNLLRAAKKKGVFIAMLSATLTEHSGRENFLMKKFNSKIFSYFDYIACVSEEAKKRIANYYKPKNKQQLENIGDTRFDRVWERFQKNKTTIPANDKLYNNQRENNLTIVAGSSYSVSENILLKFIKQEQTVHRIKNKSNLKLILVPHEIDDNHINEIIQNCKQNNLSYTLIQDKNSLKQSLYTGKLKDKSQIYIVQMMGVLVELYSLADIIFIGGSFKGSVHSILEGAVYAKAIISGPFLQNSPEAQEMNALSYMLKAENEQQFTDFLYKLINDFTYRKDIGKSAGEYVKKHTGASERFLESLSKIT